MTTQTVVIELLDSGDGWRVRQVYTNGRILSTTESYSSHYKAVRAAKRLAKLTGFAIKEV